MLPGLSSMAHPKPFLMDAEVPKKVAGAPLDEGELTPTPALTAGRAGSDLSISYWWTEARIDANERR
ncbi:hypothetical protein chiPu_0001722 [Chiloscyllium punctatum]|uniref:Uncharacterized protein n=1 Tax=Chiloscyllium punctatum TaxID=137246 RepID=A0A401RZ03_CHIPU|nr:hypothetical protein [Chiloscyllium punctatum]